MLRTIIYTRVSSDEQKKNNSPSAQRTDGMTYIEQHGLSLLDVMNEDYTGATVDRPVFNRLLELQMPVW
jgi:DNA invertase Pin-like site-specific DNA recombinase